MPTKAPCRPRSPGPRARGSRRLGRACAGYSLIELSMVLVVIGVLIGAVVSASGLLRLARGQRLMEEFVSGWRQSYLTYVSQLRMNPGDDPDNPAGVIVGPGGSAQLCNDGGSPALTNAFLAHGIAVPESPQAGQEDRRTYLDSRGVPHVLRVCMATLPWSVPGSSAGSFAVVGRPVLEITGLTVETALQFDALFDQSANARFGSFRRAALASSTAPSGDWPSAQPAGAEDAMPEVEAYLEMSGT